MTEAMNRHIPVLLNEVIEALAPALESQAEASPVLVDCTLGGAGHTEAMLKRFSGLRVLGCDVDETAIEAAHTRLSSFVTENRLGFFHGNFSALVDEVQTPAGFEPAWTAILADLG